MSRSRQDSAPGAELVASYMAARTGLNLTGARKPQLLAAITRAMNRAGIRSGEGYRSLLERDDGELQELAAHLTVGESYFFRDSDQLEVLRSEILPERAAACRDGGGLKLWSAGCATGQEAYTLAILVEEAGLGSRSRILATDLSGPAVALAQAGVFREWSLRNASDEQRKRWFRPVRGGFQVDESLGRSITFRQQNLFSPTGYDDCTEMDVILCRNVLIYLTPEAIDEAARRLASSLTPGGWLLTGPSDPPLRADGLEAVLTLAGIAYRRATTSGQAATATSASRRGAEQPATPAVPVLTRAGSPRHEQPPAPPPIGGLTEDGAHEREAAAVLIRSLGNSGELTRAIEAARIAVEAFPVDAELRLLHALVLLEDGRAEEAATAARAAVYLEPGLAMAHIALAQAEAARTNTAAARRSLRNAAAVLEAMPQDATVDLSQGEPAGRLATMVNSQEHALAAATSKSVVSTSERRVW